MLNRCQWGIVLFTGGLANLAFLFRPYWDDGGLIGGSCYFLFTNPPEDAYSLWPDPFLLKLECTAIGLIAVTGLWTLRSNARRFESILGKVGSVLQVLGLMYFLPRIPGILAPQVMCAVSLVISITTLVAVITFGLIPTLWHLATRRFRCQTA